VNHDILLYKLHNYGIHRVVHDWFRNYLTNKQYTCIGSVKSYVSCISCAVPQDSVLGPLLFLIHVNDIGNAVPNLAIKHFADDTNLFIFDQDEMSVKRMVNHSIQELNNWFITNKLSMNISNMLHDFLFRFCLK